MKRSSIRSLVLLAVASVILAGCGSRYGGIPRDPSLGPKTPSTPPSGGENPKPNPVPPVGNPK